MTDTVDPRLAEVETTLGRVRGSHRRGAFRFKGIPYAAPPVGSGRFAPPAPHPGWAGVRDATNNGPVAPQPPDTISQLLGRGDGPASSEADCLTLNVWTPAPDGARRPVLVWIHGGAFVSGSGTVPWYDGTNLTRRDVVVVTINYRLGVLGFCHLGDLGGARYAGSGNAGLADQTAALRWVRDNIAAFGGDPDNVTLFGESAGGMSVGVHLGVTALEGLFHRAIAQSGAASNISDPDRASGIATEILAELGLDAAQVDKILDVPVEALTAAQQKIAARHGIVDGLPFQPVIDGDLVPHAPLGAVRSGAAAGIDLLVGSNRDELRVYLVMNPAMRPADLGEVERRLRGIVGDRAEDLIDAYREIRGDEDPADLLEAIGTDAVFRMPALELAEAQRAHAPTRVYEFHQVSTGFGGVLGATHAIDVPYTFDNLDAPGAMVFTGDADAEMRQLAATMADAWCAFAHRGVPGAPANAPSIAGLPAWPTWEPPHHATMILEGAPHLVDDPARAQRQVWGVATG